MRQGWKIVLFFGVLLGAIIFEWTIMSVLITQGLIPDPNVWDTIDVLFFVIVLEGPAVLIVSYLFLRKVKLSFRNIGIIFHPRWFKELSRGFLVGLGLIAFIFVFGKISGVIQTSWNDLALSVIIGHGGLLLILFGFQCAAEELLFRGYPFQQCIAATNPVFSVILFSILFGILHSFNPGVTLLGIGNTIAAGALLSIAFLKTRALWLPLGIHWGWNFSQGFLFSFPVSGVTFPPDLFSTVSTGPQWIFGGSFGPEGGVIALVLLGIASVVIYRNEQLQPHESTACGIPYLEDEKAELESSVITESDV